MKHVLVFLAMFMADVFWTLYFIQVEERRAALAATASTLIVLMGMFTVLQYTHDATTAIPALLGAWLGTYVTVKWKQK